MPDIDFDAEVALREFASHSLKFLKWKHPYRNAAKCPDQLVFWVAVRTRQLRPAA
jgi:hypothetical protein